MGYDVRIVRRPGAFDSPEHQITAEEWVRYVRSDPDLRFAERDKPYFHEHMALLPGSEEDPDGWPWLQWSGGTIYAKYPQPATMAKMFEIAAHFGACLVGDEGEVYTRNADGKIAIVGQEAPTPRSRPVEPPPAVEGPGRNFEAPEYGRRLLDAILATSQFHAPFDFMQSFDVHPAAKYLFVAEPKVQAFAERAAEEFVKSVRRNVPRTPVFSDNFVAILEEGLAQIQLQVASAETSDEKLQDISIPYGSYLGESYRRNHGGAWATLNGTPALNFGGGYCSFPWDRVFKRLRHGARYNVHQWYQGMLRYARDAAPGSAAAPPPLPRKRGFLARLFGSGR